MITASKRSSSCQRRVVALALLGILVVSGCGPDGSSSDGDSNGAPSSAPDVAGTSGAASPSESGAAPAEPAEPSSAGESTAGSDDLCDIVSDEVVVEVLGIDIERREPHAGPQGKGASCIKGTARNNDLSKVSYVSVSVVPGLGGRFVDDAGAGGAVPVDGLGDRAVFLASAGALFIADGDDGIQVQVVNGGKPGGRDEDILIAEDVLARHG